MNRCAENLPIHFLTIVLNGEPFIRYHYRVIEKLPFRWHWHIVEGAAALSHDTAWSHVYGGKLSDTLHLNGLSSDGTSAYIDQLKTFNPDCITIYRPPPGQLWDGKLEMVNAPMGTIDEECLLWQLDVDEFWTPKQIVRLRQLFLENHDRTAALFCCHFYITPDLIALDDALSSHQLSANWLRVWRYSPGCRWASHEPPALLKTLDDGAIVDLGQQYPFSCHETMMEDLVFQHKAYVLLSQLLFKEQYYGYKGIAMNWLLLQKQREFPIRLKEFFPWPFIGTDTRAVPEAELGVRGIPLPDALQSCNDDPRDFSGLSSFLDRIEADVYPEAPSQIHGQITQKALEQLEGLYPVSPGMRVLDVGCGQGPALEFFRERQALYLGVTLSDEDVEACRGKGFNVQRMDQSFLKLPDQSHDLLWARHVIEHSVFPLFTLHGFNRVLRPGGMLYLEVPAPETSCHHERNPNHYSVLTKSGWRSLLERSGFRIQADVDYSFEVIAGPDLYWGFYCIKTHDSVEEAR